MLHLLRTRPPRRRLQAVAHPPQGVHVSSRQWDVIADAPGRYRERCHERIANATATTIMGGIAVTTYTARSTQHAACRRRHGASRAACRRRRGGVTIPRAARCMSAASRPRVRRAASRRPSLKPAETRKPNHCPGCSCSVQVAIAINPHHGGSTTASFLKLGTCVGIISPIECPSLQTQWGVSSVG